MYNPNKAIRDKVFPVKIGIDVKEEFKDYLDL
jgi:hypothetical protein